MLTHYTASNTQHQMTIIIIILATQMAAQKTQNTAVVKFLTKKHKNIFKTVYVIAIAIIGLKPLHLREPCY